MSSISDPSQPPTKRPRVSGAVTSSSPREAPVRTKLASVATLPTELLVIIFGYLQPRDLVSVYRTRDRAMVQLLTSGAGKSLWRAVRENDPWTKPPPCPSFMTEQYYTTLLYVNQCTTCDQIVDTITHVVRCCTACLNNLALYTVVTDVPRTGIVETLWPLLPIIRSMGAHYIATATLANLHKRVEEVEAATSPQEQLKVLRSELNKRKAEYEPVPKALRSWLARYKKDIEDHQNMIRQRRKDTIMKGVNSDAELKQLYSTLTADACAAFEALSIVKQADDIPDEEMPNVMTEIGELLRRWNLTEQYRSILRQLSDIYLCYLQAQDNSREMPDFADICSFPGIQGIIHQQAQDSSFLAQDTVVALYTSIFANEIPVWQDAANRALLAKIPDDIKARSNTPLALATVWFRTANRAQKFHSPTQYPQVLRIRYTPKPEESLDLTHTDLPADPMNLALQDWPQSQPWLELQEGILFSAPLSELAHEVVRMVGLDPVTALQQDMDSLNPRFACTCYLPGFAYTWRGAIEHQHRMDCKGRLILINDSDAMLLKQAEKEKQSKVEKGLFCARCRPFQRVDAQTVGSYSSIKEHYAECHPLLYLTDDTLSPGLDFKLTKGTDSNSGTCCGKMIVRRGTTPFTTPELVKYWIATP